MSTASTVFTRWFLPVSVILGEVALSTFTLERRLPAALRSEPSLLLVTLLFTGPALTIVAFIAFRWLDRRPEDRSSAGDALVLWLLAFLFTAHAMVLGVATGWLESLHPSLAVAAGVLLLGVAALLPLLPSRSPFGVVTATTEESPEIWRKVHRRLARWYAVSGFLVLAMSPFLEGFGLALALVPAVFGTLRAITRKGQ